MDSEELAEDVENEQLPSYQEALFLLRNALKLPTDSIGCHCGGGKPVRNRLGGCFIVVLF
jgi:hypothetical protein